MLNFLRFLKAMFLFALHQVWVDQPLWTKDDAIALGKFYVTATGLRLRTMLRNVAVRQQANAVNRKAPNDLVFEAGYCAGQKATLAMLESLADTDQFSDQGDTEADPDTTQAAS